MMPVGCHVSIAGGVEKAPQRAKNLGCETFQIFTQNQRQWRSVVIDEQTAASFREQRKLMGFEQYPIFSHASYLINMCASDPDNLKRSRAALMDELERCDALGIEYLVIHPGAHGGRGEEWGITTIADTLKEALDKIAPEVTILSETTAGQGTALGYRLEQLAEIIRQADVRDKVQVCLDTCHLFAAGYALHSLEGIQEFWKKFDEILGWQKVKCIHLNDSLKPLGSRKDRHAELGTGEMGEEVFRYLVRKTQVPGILEIPNGDEAFKRNIRLLKSIRTD
ncbi:MAG TPA: deoxyribonuclease IV [Calditrichaeota bacterium]|nr:deoxyribonuclease IV [Calditrichota bacterium]